MHEAAKHLLTFTFILIISTQTGHDMWVAFRDVDSNTWKETGVVFPVTPPAPAPAPLPNPQGKCVFMTKELTKAVNGCDKSMNETSCLIDICSNRLSLSASNLSSSNKGIDISNKNIYLRCDQECAPKRCILDGSGITRLFYGSNTNITFLNFIFANGFHPDNGGAIKVENNSIVTMINCSFVNNSASSGSAVQVNNSQLIVRGIETSVINNTGISPPLVVLSSQMFISHAIFTGNQVSKYLADVLLFDSTMDMYGVHFLNSTTVPSKDCHVYIAMIADDYTNKSSCMNVDPSNKSFPVIDLSGNCPGKLSSPTLSPIPAPPPALCFSGKNLVEIQHVGHIQMSQLCIGDYIKSSDNKFTLVYGFGHFDPIQDGTFLQIMFHDDADGEVLSAFMDQESSSFIELSVHHLIMIERNHKQYWVPAGDVHVDDILSGRRVKSIQEVIRRGIYAPLTQSGDILVNGILASNYVNLFEFFPSMILLPEQHTLAHTFFFPQQMLCRSFLELCKKEMYIHGYGPLAYLLVSSSSLLNNIMSDAIDSTMTFWFFIILVCWLIVVLVRIMRN
jgi:Hint module